MTDDFGSSFEGIAILARMAEEKRRDAALLAENKTALFDRLDRTPVARIRVEFDGGGDSGQIETIDAQSHDGAPAPLPDDALPLRLSDALDGTPRYDAQSVRDVVETLVYDCLDQGHGGWENNDGGYGTFTFDVAARTIRLEMNVRVMETVFSVDEF